MSATRPPRYLNDLADVSTAAPSPGQSLAWTGSAWAPSSAGTGDLSFTFTQSTPSASWVITHNLGKRPSVTVVDSAGDECEGDVVYTSLNTVTVTFSAGFSGSAYLN